MKGIVFNFKKRFAPDVRSGKKRQTIRAFRKDGKVPVPGTTVAHLFTGMRSKTEKCVRLRKDPEPVVIVMTVRIVQDSYEVTSTRTDGTASNEKRAKAIAASGVDRFAVLDGFESWADLTEWIGETHGFPFVGFLSAW